MALPLAVGPLAALIGRPLRIRGLPGQLAEQNARRNTRRTSSTAAALMIGLTLVVSMSVFASSLKASIGDVVADQTAADLYLKSSSDQAPGFSPSAVDAAQEVPGVAAVSASGWGEARFAGQPSGYSAVDPATVREVFKLRVTQGSVEKVGTDGLVVSASLAKANGWKLGDVVPTEFAASGKHSMRVAAVYDGRGFLSHDFLITNQAQNAFAGPQLLVSALVTVTAGSDIGRVKDSIAQALADHPDARVLDQQGFEKAAGGFIDALLIFVTVMLLLAVLIA